MAGYIPHGPLKWSWLESLVKKKKKRQFNVCSGIARSVKAAWNTMAKYLEKQNNKFMLGHFTEVPQYIK